MGNTRDFVPITSTSVEHKLRARLYGRHLLKPRQVDVNTRQPSRSRPLEWFPFVEEHMGQGKTQPLIHNCAVTVQEGCYTHHFMVFFKRHRLFTPNQCLIGLNGGQSSVLRSDIVIMRIGIKASYVNMSGRDTRLDHEKVCPRCPAFDCFLLIRFRLFKSRQFKLRILPTTLFLQKDWREVVYCKNPLQKSLYTYQQSWLVMGVHDGLPYQCINAQRVDFHSSKLKSNV